MKENNFHILTNTNPPAGSTPPVFLAATRGYHMVVEVFKRFFDTNFLIENKFQQTILHMVLKAGYNNKVSTIL